MSTPRRPLRRDAELNRQRILEAAARLIGARGLDISHDEIAREAGVGVGTVYRRFPTKEQLFDTLYDEQLNEMVAVAREAAELDDPWQGLEMFLERTFAQQADNRGLRELLIGHGGDNQLARRARETIGPVVGEIVRRAQQAGQLNPTITATDVAMIPVMVNAVIRASREVDPQMWRRWLAILLEGIATGPRRETFPGTAPSPDQLEQIISSRGSKNYSFSASKC